MRASISCGGPLERRVGGVVRVAFERWVGDAPVGERRVFRELGAHLADPVAQRDDAVEPHPGEPTQVLGRSPEMSMPRSAMTRTALGWSTFGWLPALRASTVWLDSSPSERLRDLRAGAVAGAQEQDPRLPTGDGPVGSPWAGTRVGGPDAGPRRWHTAGGRSEPGRRGSTSRARRPSCGGRTPAPRCAARAGGTRRGSGACPTRSVSSFTRRSLRASSCMSRQRSGSATSCRNSMGVGSGVGESTLTDYIKWH